MIKFDENTEIMRDNYGWCLRLWYDSTNIKTGEPTRNFHNFYYGRIDQVLNAVLERRIGLCETVEEIRKLLKEARQWDQQLLDAAKTIEEGK